MGSDASRGPGSPVVFDRRKFLWLSSACALAPALQGVAEVASAMVAPEVPLVEDLLSVGFVEGSDQLPSLHEVPWLTGGFEALSEELGGLQVVPATELSLGDQTLAGETVRVRLAGLYPRQPHVVAPFLRQARLQVIFPPDDPALEQALPFDAWSYRGTPAPMMSPPLRFVVPLGLDGRLDLSLTVLSVAMGEVAWMLRGLRREAIGEPVAPVHHLDWHGRRLETSFTVDWHDGRPKLSRGIYLLGLEPETWDRSAVLPPGKSLAALERLSLVLTVDRLTDDEADRLR